jgi:hypothetical protein
MSDAKLVNLYRKSPIAFIKDMWGLTPQPLKEEYKDKVKSVSLKEIKASWFLPFEKGKHITWQQWVILLSVEKALKYAAPKRISVASGHGVGKSGTLSWLILWYLFCFKDAQIPCTAPTSEQMHDVLWKEVAIWLERMPKEIKALYEWSAGYVRIKESPETWFARARTARKENPEALAGIHGDHVMILCDEASGIPNEIFRPAEGALTNENVLIILISNPTRLIGYFYDTHHSDKLNWQTLSFTSEDSPIVEPDYCERIKSKYGEDSDELRFMVKGTFPKEDLIDDKGYVPLLVENDLKNTTNEEFIGEIRLGVDPSGMGKNKTSWVARDKFKMKIVANEETSNGKSIAQKTIMIMEQLGMITQRPNTLMREPEIKFYKNVVFDGFGIGIDAVKELALAGYNVNVVNVGERPTGNSMEDEEDRNLYINKRAMAYDRFKKWARQGGEFVNVEKWKPILQIKYRRELSGKMKIMGKDEMRKLGIQSPDDCDAGSLTFVERDELQVKYKKFKQPEWEATSDYEGK